MGISFAFGVLEEMEGKAKADSSVRVLEAGVVGSLDYKIIEAMEQSIEEPFTLAQLAVLGGISRRQLERLFKSHLSDTPKGYYLKLRLRRARRLLEESDMNVLQIGLACGFVSASHFSRACREQYGTSPREHRRAIRSSRTAMPSWLPCR